MAKNKFKEKSMAKPVENHQTAAWANIETKRKIAQTTIPTALDTEFAKEWVEENQK